jgi:hypothetical protein
MADDRLKNLRGSSRRNFLKWSAAAASVLGLDRARFLDALSGSAGVAMADQAACSSTMRSIHIVAGNGGFAWFQLLWPHVGVAQGTSPSLAFHALGQAKPALADKPLVYAPESPFQSLGKGKQISAFMAGANLDNTGSHSQTPGAFTTAIGQSASMIAAIAAIQQANPTLIPVIGVTPLFYGSAPGAPSIVTVGSAAGLVDLFNSAASQALLANPKAAALDEAYYKAFLQMNASAGKVTTSRALASGKVANALLGKNLSEKLRPTPEERQIYGVDASTETALLEIADSLITGVKAFALGLTSCLILPAFLDDPHGAFTDLTSLGSRVQTLGKIFDGLLKHAGQIPDPSGCSRTLAEGLVFTVHGDTPKDPTVRDAWPDSTPGNSNWIYVYGNGYLKTGWHGGIDAAGAVSGFDPETGNVVPNQPSTTTTNAAAAAAAFAVSKGDMRRVQDFYQGGALSGIVNVTIA